MYLCMYVRTHMFLCNFFNSFKNAIQKQSWLTGTLINTKSNSPSTDQEMAVFCRDNIEEYHCLSFTRKQT
jgi:hypothetical protein